MTDMTTTPAAPCAPPAAPAYRPRRERHSRLLSLRHLQLHVHTWGTPALITPERPALVLVHGWMDVGASFQFLVDEIAELEGDARYIIAPDWRGFGLSSGAPVDSYWFPDYLGDLDALLREPSLGLDGESPIDLAGHSMGGNVVMLYAGVRPQRIRRLINLEGFGMPACTADQAPARYAQWLDDLAVPAERRAYASGSAVAARLVKNNPRLRADRAAWLAGHWAREGEDGQWTILGDAAHKRVNPILYRADEVLACWRAITAPVLWMEGDETDVAKWWGHRYPRSEFESRLAVVPRVRRECLAACGHMLHLDQPEALAAHLLDFLEAPGLAR